VPTQFDKRERNLPGPAFLATQCDIDVALTGIILGCCLTVPRARRVVIPEWQPVEAITLAEAST
jgi:hypothetical protein